jgi:hypothetical protein
MATPLSGGVRRKTASFHAGGFFMPARRGCPWRSLYRNQQEPIDFMDIGTIF